MRFDSPDYVLFLGLAILGFWLLARQRFYRQLFILVASCLFYMAWSPYYIGLILFSAILDYTCGREIHASSDPRRRKRWLLLSLGGNLGLLGLFKYFDFVSSAVADGLGALGLVFEAPSLSGMLNGSAGLAADALGLLGFDVSWPILSVVLPVGISFYTFQTLSYTIDIYRGKLEPERSFLSFAFFVTYFPQLVAGPIVRASELLPQISAKPKLDRDRVSRGLFLIGTGLVKKIAIADFLSVNIVDRVFDNPELFTATEVVIALYAFTMQMYCDFSGYTDVARGSARLMGFELPENFDRPYNTTNPAAFWRRWHMTLSSWLRDYLYFPLGGSRGGPIRAYWNLWLTMFLIGIWHGASWNFVIYGAVQATAMVVHRFFHRRAGRTREAVDPWLIHGLKVFACLQFVVFSRILFRAADLDNAWELTRRLFSGTTSVAQVSYLLWAVLIGTFLAHYSPRRWFQRLEETFVRLPPVAQGITLAIVAKTLGEVATSEVLPYIYFQF